MTLSWVIGLVQIKLEGGWWVDLNASTRSQITCKFQLCNFFVFLSSCLPLPSSVLSSLFSFLLSLFTNPPQSGFVPTFLPPSCSLIYTARKFGKGKMPHHTKKESRKSVSLNKTRIFLRKEMVRASNFYQVLWLSQRLWHISVRDIPTQLPQQRMTAKQNQYKGNAKLTMILLSYSKRWYIPCAWCWFYPHLTILFKPDSPAMTFRHGIKIAL